MNGSQCVNFMFKSPERYGVTENQSFKTGLSKITILNVVGFLSRLESLRNTFFSLGILDLL